MNKKSLLIAPVLMMMSACALAATLTNDTHFGTLYEMVKGWTSGYLGATIAMAFLVVGLGFGVIAGRIIAAVSCIAACVALVVGPTVIEGIFSFVI